MGEPAVFKREISAVIFKRVVMVILHIASIRENTLNGINIVVPKHVVSQGKYTETALLNIKNVTIAGVENQIAFDKDFELSNLKPPFDNPDLVVFHDCYYYEYLKLAKDFYEKGIPYIIVPHAALGKDAQRTKRYKKLPANILFFNKMFRHAAKIQFLSQNEMKESLFREKGFVATNGIDLPQSIKSEFSSRGVRFVYIGRTQVLTKGIDLLIKAVKKKEEFMRENNATVELFGPDREGRHKKIRKLIKKYKLEGLVTLNDKVTGREKEEKLLATDIFIQTSRIEGMPMGILEALGCGIPCLVTKGTCLGDVVDKYNAGWVAETDVDSIAEKIEAAIKDRESWSEKSKNGRVLIRENFMWEAVSSDAIEQYKKIVKEKEPKI